LEKARGGRAGSRSGYAQHRNTEIETRHRGSAIPERKRNVPRAATHIQSPCSRRNAGQPHQFAFPKTVQAQTLEIIDEIVARSDIPEQILDALGARLSCLIIGVGHAIANNVAAAPIWAMPIAKTRSE